MDQRLHPVVHLGILRGRHRLGGICGQRDLVREKITYKVHDRGDSQPDEQTLASADGLPADEQDRAQESQ